MTTLPTPTRLFDDLRGDLGRLADLPTSQSRENEDLDKALRADVTIALTNVRTVKDAAMQARRQLDVLIGRIDRLAARAQVPIDADGPASTPAPDRIADFGPAITIAGQDVASAETAWAWAERTQTTVARQATDVVSTPLATPPAPPIEPTPKPAALKRIFIVVGAAAVLLLIVAIVLIIA